jgi:hypothetical protein
LSLFRTSKLAIIIDLLKFRRSKEFFGRSKVAKVAKALIATFDHLKNLLVTSTIMRSKVFN